ncbi:MAG: outer membrane protein assembly factor BamB family protein, partial [Planctomycetota bacterium]
MAKTQVRKSNLFTGRPGRLPLQKKRWPLIMGLMVILVASEGGLLFVTNTAHAENWPCWRGPRNDGTCIEKSVPVNWDPAGATWKVQLPGKGHASPIVWEDRICTVTGITDTKERILLCIDRKNGKVLWRETVVQGPLQKLHKENSYASSTPATDGSRVFVTFRVGDEIVVAAHDLATGKQIWQVRPGTHKGEWGFCNSPVLFDNKVFVDGDGKDKSFLIALRQSDGETVWRKNRKNKGISYSAPFIRKLAGRTQLIQCGDRSVGGFDPQTGEQFWIVDGPSQEFVATPVYSEKAGLLLISSSWPKQVLLAIRPDGKGNVTKTHV